jgi:hypothetical protein
MVLHDLLTHCKAYTGAFIVYLAIQALEHLEYLVGIEILESYTVIAERDL